MVHQIKNEAFNNSKVMDTMFWLCDANGPRLSGSPGYRKAAEWVKKSLSEQGIEAKFEPFEFGRGWQHSKFAARMTEPAIGEIIGFPMAWTPGTNGIVSGEAMHATLATQADLDKWKGKLSGKIVLVDVPRVLEFPDKANGHRYTGEELGKLAEAPDPGAAGPGRAGARPGGPPMSREQMMAFRDKLYQFMKDEGILVVVKTSYAGDGGAVFGSAGGPYQKGKPVPPPTAVIAAENYNRVIRLLEKKVPVKLEFEIAAQFNEEADNAFNVIAEIPGTSKKGEYVMIGAHLDSWHGGTGATDNASGSAVMLEAMRILKALNVKTARSIRLGLWCGEEEGLIGSRAYVKSHLADPADMKLKPDHGRVTAYFNVDNGSGKIRGIYTQGNEMVRKLFGQWLEPFMDLGVSTVTSRNTGGTDHLSFDAVGVPGFQFIQDPLDYSTRTHHSNMDTIDRVQKGDLMQMAAIVASFAYHAANRDAQVPRKPLPKPTPRPGEGQAPPAPSSAAANQE
ncbi:M20/M25/M40 family metallo-hydrolase [Bryobacter aggregatus]|uniref:M20/M25/M40 family metallo-hydrolase n=1 Tax=Bryobacter aggregatus TaxID=360054 RepID=UPI001EE2B8FA|nr:M20/M25/M40 family metallo-hydrolase [Bryobacter aggregatus]